jgi:hypothetical protein
LSEEEVLQQNCTIISDVAFEKAEQRLKDWFDVEGSKLQIHHQERTMVNRQLMQKIISDERKNELGEEAMQLEQQINQFAAERKELESNVSILWKACAEEKKKLKKIRNDKGKQDRPIRQYVIHFFEAQYEISSAAYHGGDLNGVCCRRLLLDGTKIFKEIKEYLLGYQHNNPDCCSYGEIMLTCELHGQILGYWTASAPY